MLKSKPTIVVSRASLRALELKIQKFLTLSDRLDVLAFEVRYISTFLKDACKKMYMEKDDMEKHD